MQNCNGECGNVGWKQVATQVQNRVIKACHALSEDNCDPLHVGTPNTSCLADPRASSVILQSVSS